jgi:hypothetical protein
MSDKYHYLVWSAIRICYAATRAPLAGLRLDIRSDAAEARTFAQPIAYL